MSRGRGSNPVSRANLAKGSAARNAYVFTRDTFAGEWQPLFGPYHWRDACAKAIALCTAAGSPEYASVSTLTDAAAYQRGALKGARAKRYLDSLAYENPIP